MNKQLAICLLMVFVIRLGGTTDPCTKPMAFTNLNRRSSTNVRNLTTTPLSDRFITEGWYGQRYVKISNSTPGINHCGTVYPIYLQGADPVAGPVTNRTFCVHTRRGPCDRTIKIETKRCDKFLAYNLRRTFSGYAAYCVDDLSDDHPEYVTSVNVDILPLKEEDENRYEFVCNFQTSTRPAHNNIWYTVTWYVNNQLIKTVFAFQKSPDVQAKTLLTENELKAAGIQTVGFQIRCGYAVSHTADSATSSVTSSNDRFIGLEILTPTVYVRDGEEANIIVRPTAPIGCLSFHPFCELQVNLLKVKKDDDCALSPTFTACGLKVRAGAEWNANFSIKVQGNFPNSFTNLYATKYLNLKTESFFDFHQFWGNYSIGSVKIVVSQDATPIKNKECYAVCDPHMKTFHGTRYEHHYEGVFTLYENKAWKQEVQIQTKPCRRGTWVTCVCGIAIRVGREVYKREICSDSFVKTGYAQCDGPSLINVKKSGNNQHKIRLPSSTIIKVVTTGNFLNVYMYPSVADKGKVRGLCGQITTSTFIGRDNSVSTYKWSGMPSFSDSWRVNGNLINLFSKDQIDRLEGAVGNMFLCKCDETSPTRISCNNSEACSHKEIFKYTLVPVCEKNFIEKRSVGNHYQVPRSSAPEFTHISKRQTTNHIWRNGWTEKLATDHCKGLLNNSKTVQICEKSGAAGTKEALSNCVRDIKLIGDDTFANVAVETVKTTCFHEISNNPIYQRQRETEVTRPPTSTTVRPRRWFGWSRQRPGPEAALETVTIPSFFDEIKQVACPLECSQHGICNQGVCKCDDGYGSLDCSISLNTPPTIVYESSANECNAVNGTCNQVSLLGGEFVESTTLVCKIRIEETINGKKSLVAETTVSAIYVSDGEVVCPEVVYTRSILPGVSYSYGVAVSNNGVVFSDQIFLPNN